MGNVITRLPNVRESHLFCRPFDCSSLRRQIQENTMQMWMRASSHSHHPIWGSVFWHWKPQTVRKKNSLNKATVDLHGLDTQTYEHTHRSRNNDKSGILFSFLAQCKNTSCSKHSCEKKKSNLKNWSQGEQTVATVQDYDVRCLLKEKTFLTKMNEWYRALAWQTRAEVSQVFYDGP